MALIHLSEDEIQSYLDGDSSGRNNFIREHFEVCSDCRDAVADYEALYNILKSDREFDLPNGFAGSIAARVGIRSARSGFNYFDVLSGVAGVMMAFTVMFFYFDFRVINGLFATLRSTELPMLQILAVPAWDLFTNLSSSLDIFGFSVLILFIMAAIDHLVLKPRYRQLIL